MEALAARKCLAYSISGEDKLPQGPEKENRMAKIADIEGIGPVYAEKLKAAKVASTAALLKQGATPESRQALAEKSGIGHDLLLQWVNHVDLYRIKGVGSEYSDLLEAAGVDTVPELAQRDPANLYNTLMQANVEKKLVRRPPTEKQVKDWVKQAKKLKRVITY
jgi:predicted flap endonuclease-1-like 5' DNA nuclease